MRVVALLSGGKDSVCAVETARGHGWDVVAALALRPAQDDAWMFHTPNLDAVRGVADCLGLPLLEAPARHGEREEAEDLGRALAEAQRRFRPDGVVSGALASEYQRTRIEEAGHRLGLKTFAPLWHKEPLAYVGSLIAGGWDMRFSRIAADGIPLAWAGERLTAERLAALASARTRPHVAGEGGEYETLVLDAPCYAKRLVVEEARVEQSATRATWTVGRWRTVAKPVPPQA